MEEQRTVCYSEHGYKLGGDAADGEDARQDFGGVYHI